MFRFLVDMFYRVYAFSVFRRNFSAFVGVWVVCVLGSVWLKVVVSGCVWFEFEVFYYVVMGDLLGVYCRVLVV